MRWFSLLLVWLILKTDCKEFKIMLKFLIEKEFKQLMRNPFLPKLIMVMPCLVMLIFPWATTMEIKNIKLAVVDSDNSVSSNTLVDKVVASGYFNIADYYGDYDEALEAVEYDKADLILEIPSGFEQDIRRENHSSVSVSANAVNASKANFGTSYITSIVQDFSADLASSSGLVSSSVEKSAGAMSSFGGISVIPYFRFNPTMDYKVPMVPALMVLILTMMCGFLPALNVVGEKEIGTIEQINVSPVPKWAFILGKLLPFWIIGILVFSIAMLISIPLYHLIPLGSVALLYGLMLLYIFAVSGMGLIVSNYSSTLQQANFMMFFFMIVMFLISGLFTPIASMPFWAQILAHFSPLTYFVEINRSIYLKGSIFSDLYVQVLALIGFFIVFTTWAIASYRKRN